MQVNIVVRSENDNLKAHARFWDLKLTLEFEGTEIARLMADPYDVKKNSSVDFNFVATAEPLSLSPRQMQEVEIFLNEDRVRLDLKGSVKTRWRVGLFGSVNFLSHLNCQLYFHVSDGSYVPSRCTSKAK
uniref:Uncharacterized protein MANES_07G043400 n=1 Tax=Rhizophora mucronata TaxID=61149 RepID=A0A2P2QGG0_RHIMU